MRSLVLLLVAISLSGDTPVYSRHIRRHKDCLMHMECKKGNKLIQSWEELGKGYWKWKKELTRFFTVADKLGIKLYISKEKHFGKNNQGVYNRVYNNIYLNEKIIPYPRGTVRVIRHEIWHAVQDCSVGGLYNNSDKPIFSKDKLPQWSKEAAEDLYKNTSDETKHEEAEAMYVSLKRYKAVEFLEKCAEEKL